MSKATAVALYMRISKEDGLEESHSIASQREILVDYVQKNGWQYIEEYIDDGYSGTSFDRPQFKRLIENIELGTVGTVITKDLSRLGRNYVQVGYYTEEYFPLKGVRYIALNDGYDSEKERSGELVPFKNVINEWYARDISKKIRSVLEAKAKSGKARNTVFPIFGYAYNESYERVLDPETSPIVRLIYAKFIELGSTGKVAKFLQEQKIKTPSYYNAVKYGYNKYSVLNEDTNHCNWLRSTVREIIIKEEYLGDYITAKTKTFSFKNKKRLKNLNSYVFKGIYPPVVDRQTWLTANAILKKSKGVGNGSKNYLNGFLICADCGKPLRYEGRSNGKIRYYCVFKNCNRGNTICGEGVDLVIKIAIKTALSIFRLYENEIVNSVCEDLFSRDKENNGLDEIKKRRDKALALSEGLLKQYLQGVIPENIYKSVLNRAYIQLKQADEDEQRLLRCGNKGLYRKEDVRSVISGLTVKDENLKAFVRRLVKTVEIKRLTEKREYEVKIVLFGDVVK